MGPQHLLLVALWLPLAATLRCVRRSQSVLCVCVVSGAGGALLPCAVWAASLSQLIGCTLTCRRPTQTGEAKGLRLVSCFCSVPPPEICNCAGVNFTLPSTATMECCTALRPLCQNKASGIACGDVYAFCLDQLATPDLQRRVTQLFVSSSCPGGFWIFV